MRFFQRTRVALGLATALLATVGHASSATADAAVPATLTPAQQGSVDRIAGALNAITTLKAHFLQIAPDGATSQGTAWLDRPGRMRFAYDKPSPLLLVAADGKVTFVDSKLGQTTEIPLSRTPLGLLLAPKIALTGPVTVTNVTDGPGQVQATLERTASPADGSLTLVFSTAPFALRSWTVVDAQGRDTKVDLYDVTLGGHVPDDLFRIGDTP